MHAVVTEFSARNFGLAIAFFIPGFVALWGVAEICDPVQRWLTGSETAGPSIGGVAYVAAASLALGLTVSAIRWASIDQLHHCTGVAPPRLDFEKLPERLEAFYALVENHYRYYQFYANMAVATAFTFGMKCVGGDDMTALAYVAVLGLETVFLSGSRDALRKYYERSSLLLGEQESEDSMTNGFHPADGSMEPAKEPKHSESRPAARATATDRQVVKDAETVKTATPDSPKKKPVR